MIDERSSNLNLRKMIPEPQTGIEAQPFDDMWDGPTIELHIERAHMLCLRDIKSIYTELYIYIYIYISI